MAKQDPETLTIGRIKALLKDHTLGSRRRILAFLSDAIAEMPAPKGAPVDPRQLAIPATQPSAAPESPFDA